MAVITTTRKTRRGRPPKADKGADWHLRIPQSISHAWDMILYDPQLGRSKLGVRQFIVTELMRLLLEAWQKGAKTIEVDHILARVAKELTSLETFEDEVAAASATLPEDPKDLL